VSRLRIIDRARLLVVGALPFGLFLTVATTARHLHTDVLVFVVVSYLGVSTLSLHGLVQLGEQATRPLGPAGHRYREQPMSADAHVLQFPPHSSRTRQPGGSGISRP
jgi:hypothetical protein